MATPSASAKKSLPVVDRTAERARAALGVVPGRPSRSSSQKGGGGAMPRTRASASPCRSNTRSPRAVLSQRRPAPSSTIPKTPSVGSPSVGPKQAAAAASNGAARSIRHSPRSTVPTHARPSSSTKTAATRFEVKPSASPRGVMAPSAAIRSKPPPIDPATTPPSAVAARVLQAWEASTGGTNSVHWAIGAPRVPRQIDRRAAIQATRSRPPVATAQIRSANPSRTGSPLGRHSSPASTQGSRRAVRTPPSGKVVRGQINRRTNPSSGPGPTPASTCPPARTRTSPPLAPAQTPPSGCGKRPSAPGTSAGVLKATPEAAGRRSRTTSAPWANQSAPSGPRRADE